MENLETINARIQEIENNYQRGAIDLAEKETYTEEVLKQYTGEDRIIPMKDFKMPKYDPANYFVSGIKKLDDIIGSFRRGDIFTITAGSGVGKSTFARELLIRFAEQKKHCLYFSYEDRNEGLIEKLGDSIPDGYIPMTLNDRSLIWIEARILEAVLKYKVEVVFIDNLKSITDFMARNVNNSIEFTMQKLKEIAMKYNALIFLCAHIKKEEGKTIDLNSIKDSSSVADTSSLVIALRRNQDLTQSEDDEKENGVRMGNVTTVSIIKNRNNGIQKGFTMLFKSNGVSGRFIDEFVKGGSIVSAEDIEVNELFKK